MIDIVIYLSIGVHPNEAAELSQVEDAEFIESHVYEVTMAEYGILVYATWVGVCPVRAGNRVENLVLHAHPLPRNQKRGRYDFFRSGVGAAVAR